VSHVTAPDKRERERERERRGSGDLESLLDSPSFVNPLLLEVLGGGGGGGFQSAKGGDEVRKGWGGIFGGVTRSVLEVFSVIVVEGGSGAGGGGAGEAVDETIFDMCASHFVLRESVRADFVGRGYGRGRGVESVCDNQVGECDTQVREQVAACVQEEEESGVSQAVKTGEEKGKGNRRVVVLTVVYSQPHMLDWQVASFRKHLLESVAEFLVVIDASSAAIRAEFVDICARLQLRAVMSPFQAQAKKWEASYLHGQVCLV